MQNFSIEHQIKEVSHDPTYFNPALRYKDTPAHGYYYPSEGMTKNIPSKFRKSCYEEDCDWAIPVIFNRVMFGTDVQRNALEAAVTWHPECYESLTGEFIPFGVSLIKDEKDLIDKGLHQVLGARGDWTFDVPLGQVMVMVGTYKYDHDQRMWVKTVIKTVLIPAKEYKNLPKYGASICTILPRDNWPEYECQDGYNTWEDYEKQTGLARYK